MTLAIAILMKAPSQAKTRLRPVLDASLREGLARRMFGNTVASAVNWRIAAHVGVVTPSGEIAALAARLGAEAVPEAGPGGINAAAGLAADWARGRGAGRLLILHADIPVLERAEIDRLLREGGPDDVVIADSTDGGTNALLLPTSADLPFRFGPDSAAAHAAAARAAGLRPVRLSLPHLSRDLDTPADLLACFPQIAGAGAENIFRQEPKELCR